MECNKDEATRAKEIAEKKFSDKDMVGAKKFALKAQNLYPELQGISQMVTTVNVYVCAENKVHGESDWYGILGVNPMADEDTIKKQFKKLALALHPDKNKCVGAEGAFQLVSEAWKKLSDKAARGAYDQKRRAKIFQRVSTATTGSAAPPRSTNGFGNFARRASPPSSTKVDKTVSEQPLQPQPSQKKQPGTFWTVCYRCATQFEYPRKYVNNNLLCPNCRVAFYAAETSPPTLNGNMSSKFWKCLQHQKGGKNKSSSKESNRGVKGAASSINHNSSNQQTFRWAPFKGGGDDASAVAKAASVVQQAYQTVKRVREEAQAASKREEALKRKQSHKKSSASAGKAPSTSSSVASKRTIVRDGNDREEVVNPTGSQIGLEGTGSIHSYYPLKDGNVETSGSGGTVKLNMFREVPQTELKKILIEKAKSVIRQKLDQWGGPVNVSGEDKKDKKRDDSIEEPLPEVDNQRACNRGPASRVVSGMNVPDSDFHDFDLNRTERSFRGNEVWAAYDGNDGMPRYYALIQNVVSLNPFKLQISWLNSKSNAEFGPLNWVGSGFMKTCGEFRVGKYEIINGSLNSFSHKVGWTKGARGVILIYPKKGDIWALYRNWSPDWNKKTTVDVIHKYDMVEVLEDYDEEGGGIDVAPLVKVAGFKTVFKRHVDPRKNRRIPREEMFRFSHHVLSRTLTGEEGRGAPRGCWELDPAALPLELIQATAVRDVKKREAVDGEGTSDIEYDMRSVKRRKIIDPKESGEPKMIDVDGS